MEELRSNSVMTEQVSALKIAEYIEKFYAPEPTSNELQ